MEKPNVSSLAELINRCAGVFGGFIAGVICTFAFVTVLGRVDLNNSGSHREKLRLPEDFAKYADGPSAANNPAANRPAGLLEGGSANAIPQVVRFDDLDGKPSTGPKNAPVTIVEFSDFHCPFSKRVQPTIQKLIDSYPGKIRHVWRHFPLPMHQGADRTHAASQCAMDQGKFWEFHSAVFAAPSLPTSDQGLIDLAAQVGVEPKAFESCLSSNKYISLVQQEVAAGQKTGTSGTPTFFINGKRFVGAQPYETFEKTVQQEIDESKK